MKQLTLIIIIILVIPSVAQPTELVTGEQVRDQIIEQTSGESLNKHTCRRVRELGKSTVSDVECQKRLHTVNMECLSLAKKKVSEVSTTTEGELLTDILMLCPIAKILDIEFRVVNKKVYVNWEKIGKAG